MFASASALGLASPAFAAQPPRMADASNTVATVRANVDDFTFSSFDAVYSLSTDDAGYSIMTVQETLVAQFPDFDQNRGIRRLLVGNYDGHSTDLTLVSVTDGEGTPRPYTEATIGSDLELVIADENFVRGEQTYVITYTQRDVTKYYADTGATEFYWDVNGFLSPQPFDRVTATVEVDPALLPRLTGKADATYGVQGATNKASITETDTGYFFEASNLGPYENLTFAIGFEPDTFTQRDTGFFASVFPSLSLLGALGSLATIVWAFVVRRTKLRDAPGRGIVVPEYDAPRGVSIVLAAIIGNHTAKINAAQITSLAISGYLRVVDAGPAGGAPIYALQFLTTEPVATKPRVVGRDNDPINADELEFLRALFGNDLVPGATYWLKQRNPAVGLRITALVNRVRRETFTLGYRSKISLGLMLLISASTLVSGAVAFISGAASLNGGYGAGIPVITLLIGMVPWVVLCVMLLRRKKLEPKGVELRDHLLGLRDYINWAEADRLNYLQSPEGAERTTVDANSPSQVLKLYEELLPYAVLFGLDKQWTAELGRYYDQTATDPYWYTGPNGRDNLDFGAGIALVSASTWPSGSGRDSGSDYSSSSGGSDGGSSSGGGGGGGGVGGV